VSGGLGLPARWRLVALDLVAACLAAGTFLQGGEPDLLFHAIWLVLVIEAFWYGLRVSVVRIAIVAALVIGYSFLEDASGLRPLEVPDLLFTEWPLMFAIIVLVAIMADRVTSANRDIASLERRTHDQLVTAREDERRRLSGDLHDGLGQTLTALVLNLDAVESSIDQEGAATTPAAREALHRAQEIAGLALEETRDVARRLRPARMRQIGLANAIRELAAHAGRPVEVEFDPRLATPDLLAVDDEMEVYRIVQEAVANAVRHASANRISIGIRAARGGRLLIEVADDGIGFDPRRIGDDGLGLHGMGARAESIGGTLRIESHDGLGTRIRLLVPTPAGRPAAGARARPPAAEPRPVRAGLPERVADPVGPGAAG
jgi:signal transduction histidine kinase